MEYKIDDRVHFMGNSVSAPDNGTVILVKDGYVTAKWDSDGAEQGFYSDDEAFRKIISTSIITRDTVKKVLDAYCAWRGCDPETSTDALDGTFNQLQKSEDPEYKTFLKLKARFEPKE